jgi:hypothetical protein
MKYVMFAITQDGLTHNVPVLFPTSLIHADVAAVLLTGPLKGYQVVSAGEGTILSLGLHGKSTTLGLSSRVIDSKILNTIDYLMGLTEAPEDATVQEPKAKGPQPGWSV